MTVPDRGHCRLREHRFSQPFRVYFVTSCVNERLPLLKSKDAARLVFKHLKGLETEGAVSELIASVVMPDHLHALLRLSGLSLAAVMRRFRGRTAVALNALLHRQGQFWQRGFFEHALRPDESLEPVLHYMWHNPEPAGNGFRCRHDVWLWFKSCVTKEAQYAPWLLRHPTGDGQRVGAALAAIEPILESRPNRR